MGVPGFAPSGSSRPRDRGRQIAVAAASLFRDRGFHQVGIEDIASAVGITGRAVYRHFANKRELLAFVVADGMAHMERALPSGKPPMTLAGALHALAAAALDRREWGALVTREAGHLEDRERADLDRRHRAVVSRLAALVGRERPDLSKHNAEVLSRAALAVLASPSYHHVPLAPAREQVLLEDMVTQVVMSAIPTTTRSVATKQAEAPRGWTSRREAVLAAATARFARDGYAATRMEDIGADVGIAGPSIYQHFSGKADLLVTVLRRGSDWLQRGLAESFASSGAPLPTLEAVLGSYVDFMANHPDVLKVLVTELGYLPDEDRRLVGKLQHDYISEWVELLVAVRPQLTASDARFITHGVLGVVNDSLFRDRPWLGPGEDDVLVALGLAALGVGAAVSAAPTT